MSAFTLEPEKLKGLRGRVVVITGGANGIGAEVVRILVNHGAKVVFGDLDVSAGESLTRSLRSTELHFLATDVSKYQSILALFRKAFELYSRVDIAISNAGIIERPGWFEASLDLESIQTPPDTSTLDINLTGTLYFTRIAAVYLRQNANRTDDKSLVLLSSVAGFEESPGIFVYQASKHGVIGLMRSLRKYFPTAYPESAIRVNCVCPWATSTGMVASFHDAWVQAGLPMNSPLDVANTIVSVALDSKLDGESVYVEGGNSWLFEENLRRLQPKWLGQSPYDNLMKGQAFLASGEKW